MDLTSSLIAGAYSGVSSFPNLLAAAYETNIPQIYSPILAPLPSIGPLLFLIFAFGLVMFFVLILSLWIIFQKAGKPGWASIVPIYNTIVLLEIIEQPVWWLVFCFLPYVNGIFAMVLSYYLAKSFGKSTGFTVGLILLPIIFYPMLAFGDSTYKGVQENGGNVPPSPYPPTPSNPPYASAPQQNSTYSPASYQQPATPSQFVNYSHNAPQNPSQQPPVTPTPPPQPQAQNPSYPQNPPQPPVPPVPPLQ